MLTNKEDFEAHRKHFFKEIQKDFKYLSIL